MRQKSLLRIFIEEYLASDDEDWLQIPYRTKQERNKIRSMAYSIDRTLVIDTVNYNGHTSIMIHKRPTD